MGQRPGEDLPARLHGAVQSVFLRWHDEMSFGPVHVQDFPEPWDELERLDDDGPFWDGEPYCHLRHVWWRGRIVIPQDVDTLLASAAPLGEGDRGIEAYGSVYALWVTMADLRLDWHASAHRLVEVGRWIDIALHMQLSDEWYEGGGSMPRAWLPEAGQDTGTGSAAGRSGAIKGALATMDPSRQDLAGRLAEQLAAVESLTGRAADRIEKLADVDACAHGWDELIAVRQLLHRLEADMAKVLVRCVTAEPMLISYMETSWRRSGLDE